MSRRIKGVLPFDGEELAPDPTPVQNNVDQDKKSKDQAVMFVDLRYCL